MDSLMGSLIGAAASERVTEAPKYLQRDGEKKEEPDREPTGRAGTKVGQSRHPVVERNAIAQRIKATL